MHENAMSHTIKILPESLANKIAAGEVIQRPASAVKELVENAIDAQAKSVTVIIEEGGKNLIQVVDDGTGMSIDDALIAFQRHATSKIATYDDLENITTLGFRGEALASISAVAQIEMITRSASSDTAVKVSIHSSNLIDHTPCAGPIGTSVVAKNLFFNTPGRKNFLKSNPTEFKHVIEAVQRMAISYPEIAWKFISDGETIFNLKPALMAERLTDIFGERLTSSLLPIEQENELIRLRGFLSRPDFSRKTRAEQFLFLNRRHILNRSIAYAVVQGYENLLIRGTFPVFMLFLEINPRRIDINVHPTKMEVKFDDERGIYRFVAASVRKVLSASNLIPVVPEDKKAQDRLESGGMVSSVPLIKFPGQYPRDQDFSAMGISRTEIPSQTEAGGSIIPSTDRQVELAKLDQMTQSGEINADVGYTIQLFNKYILSIVEDGFYLIDQHAAHERILYERAVEKITTRKPETQELLFPQTIQMSASDTALVKELLPFMQSLGFSLKFFSSSTIIIDGVPLDVKPGKERTILQDIIDAFKEDEHGIPLEPYERLAKSFACKAAIKAGDSLKGSEIHALINQLFSCKMPFSCPHGRPVTIKYPLSDLDRRFGRSS